MGFQAFLRPCVGLAVRFTHRSQRTESEIKPGTLQMGNFVYTETRRLITSHNVDAVVASVEDGVT